ncbi:hypothetical protein GQ44DRAFT_723334 [Phaeosphaeriaceae sp. PMI808]|nr:hypothetical protein GQ44DRAFT_723334 [Phaeosphaeriaceae sp. PMI808]
MSMVNKITLRCCASEVFYGEPRNTMPDIWSLGLVRVSGDDCHLERRVAAIDERILSTTWVEKYFVHQNPVAMSEYVTYLATVGEQGDNKPLGWITSMLQETQNGRPTAKALIDQITSCASMGINTRFCGVCCVLPEGDGLSGVGSGWYFLKKSLK